jgi:hypothetical protein
LRARSSKQVVAPEVEVNQRAGRREELRHDALEPLVDALAQRSTGRRQRLAVLVEKRGPCLAESRGRDSQIPELPLDGRRPRQGPALIALPPGGVQRRDGVRAGERLCPSQARQLIASRECVQVFQDEDVEVFGRLHDRGVHPRHADRRVRCHLAIEADLALVDVRRLGEVEEVAQRRQGRE